VLRAAALLLSSLAGLGSAVSDPSGHSTMLGYDGAGNLVLLRTPDGAETGWEYDGLGRRVQVRDPAARRGSARVLRDPRPAGVGAVPESCRILDRPARRKAGEGAHGQWRCRTGRLLEGPGSSRGQANTGKAAAVRCARGVWRDSTRRWVCSFRGVEAWTRRTLSSVRPGR
jgi:YD repeat-containing protein